jgi:hypothetical protein
MTTKIVRDKLGRQRVLTYHKDGSVSLEPIEKYELGGSNDGLGHDVSNADKKALKDKSRKKSNKLRIHERLVRRQPVPKMSKSAAMFSIAKAFCELGRPTDIEKREWYKELMDRSGPSPSAFAAFVKTPDGKTLFETYKSAPGRDWQGDDPEDPEDEKDDEDEQDPENDPAYQKLSAARNLMKSNPTLSFPSAFAKAVNLHPALMKASTAVQRARIAKSYEGKPNVPNGETGDQHPGLSQYQELMERARKIQLEGGSGRSVASIFSELYQNKGQLVPGPDKGKKGSDRAASLQPAERQTRQRLRTEKQYNANQKPMDVGGAEGFSFRKA